MPTVHGVPGAACPRMAMSPPALMVKSVWPWASRMCAARSMDQPLTTPDGSRVVPFGAGTANGVERAIGGVVESLAEQQDVGDLVVDVVEGDLGSAEPGDRAVVDVRAEGLVDVVEPGDGLVEAVVGPGSVSRMSNATAVPITCSTWWSPTGGARW